MYLSYPVSLRTTTRQTCCTNTWLFCRTVIISTRRSAFSCRTLSSATVAPACTSERYATVQLLQYRLYLYWACFIVPFRRLTTFKNSNIVSMANCHILIAFSPVLTAYVTVVATWSHCLLNCYLLLIRPVNPDYARKIIQYNTHIRCVLIYTV